MKSVFLLILLSVLPYVTLADFRINLIAPEGVAFVDIDEGLTGMQGGWLKEKKDTYLFLSGPLDSRWKSWRFSVVPKRDGFLTIQLVTEGKENGKDLRAAYTGVRLEGADLRNGALTEVVNGKPVAWSAVRTPGFGSDAGKNFLLCDRLNYWTQKIRVEKGRPLQFQILVRKGKP